MAITENEYTGNGSTVLYSFTFPYLEVADIKVSLDGTLTTAYTLANATTVQFNTAPANGVAIRLFRQTNDDALNAQFFPGSAIRSTDLNNNFTQNLYVTQESNRDATQGITTADAATATANTALSNSSAAVSTANTASSNASAAVSTANTASSNASAAVSTANTASSNATTAVSTANAATATANSAASDAATAISTANSALSTANTASTTATNAVNTANSASSAASSAVSTANTASSNASAAVSTANTASSNATSAVNTANSALSTANAAASAVANAILYDIVANVAAIPASPANNDAVEVIDSTGIESFTPLTSIPGGFAGNSGLSVRIVYTTTGNTWTWIQYFPNDPETRYLKEAVTTSDTAPVSPSDGDLWYDSVGGRTYVYYDDGAGSQWVDTSPQGSGVSDAISEGNTSAEVIDTGSDGRFVVTTEGSERLRITSAGRVGIGTNSPQDTLTVDTSIGVYRASSDPTLSFSVGGTVSAPTKSYRLLIDDSDSDKFQLRDGVTPRVTVDGSGNVGIGTTSPPPGALLAVNGQPWVLNQNALLFMNADNTLGCYINGSGAGGVNPDMVFSTSYNERARIDNSGRLGIGTSSPSTPLEVAGAVGSGVISDYLSLYYPQSYGGGGSGPRMLFKANDIAGTKSTYAGIWSLLHANTVGAHSGKLVFGTTSGGNLVERLRIDESGNVGIGTTTVDEKLHLEGSSGANTNIKVESTATGSERSSIEFWNGTISRGRVGGDNTFDGLTLDSSTTSGTSVIRFRTAGGSGFNEKARLDASGRLLVGTSSSTDSALLIVQGNTVASTSAGAINIATGTATPADGGALGIIRFSDSGHSESVSITGRRDGGTWSASSKPSRLMFATTADGASSPTERMRISSAGDFICPNIYNGTVANAANVYVGANGQLYRSTSSIKYKTDVETLQDSYADAILGCRPVWYRSTSSGDNPNHGFWGFIAEEVAAIDPRLVQWKTAQISYDEKGSAVETQLDTPEPDGVQYDRFVPHLLNLIKRQQQAIETLEATNASLEARLTALEGGTN
jgi:hypothetical protein